MTNMGYHIFISSSGVMQFREVCYTVVSYAPYIPLQIYTITNLATFQVTIFDFFHLGPQPIRPVLMYMKVASAECKYMIYHSNIIIFLPFT